MQRLGDLSADGSRLALEHVSESRLNAMRARRHSAETDFSNLWLSGLTEDPLERLACYGWQATVYDTGERAAGYGRPVQEALDATSRWLISASRTRAQQSLWGTRTVRRSGWECGVSLAALVPTRSGPSFW